jgi:hypothetical protein
MIDDRPKIVFSNVGPGLIVEERLTLDQQFRLIEIAYETRDPDICKAAMTLLEQALFPPHFVAPSNVA